MPQSQVGRAARAASASSKRMHATKHSSAATPGAWQSVTLQATLQAGAGAEPPALVQAQQQQRVAATLSTLLGGSLQGASLR